VRNSGCFSLLPLSPNSTLLNIFQLILWALVPPLVVLVCYYRPLRSALSRSKLLLLFLLGNLAGAAALGLQWGFEEFLNQFVDYNQLTRPLIGAALRQFLEVAPLEEGTKLVTVLWAIGYFGRRNWVVPTQPATTFIAATAVALGFAAEENLVYLWNGTASVFARLVGTPVHAFFSAPWGYALGLPVYQTLGIFRRQWRRRFLRTWCDAVVCHAVVNILSIAWSYPEPDRWLGYGLFPFLLWLLWRMDHYWRLAQGRSSLPLISGSTWKERLWQRTLAGLALLLGGNAILGLFMLGNQLSALNLSLVLADSNTRFWRTVINWLVLSLIPAAVAIAIYFYLRKSTIRRYFSNRFR
jgi:RsiW-degrading membrane proteinase PrsW (M82 family)